MKLRIAELRQKASMTQEKLAEKSGVSRVTICELENNSQYNTTSKTLAAIADALGVKPQELFL